MTALIPILIVLVLAAIGVLGDYFIKLSGNGQNYISVPLFLIGMCIYASTAFGWFFVMKHMKLGTLGVFYGLSSVIFLAVISIVFFKEQMNIYDVIGIALGIVSMILLARFG